MRTSMDATFTMSDFDVADRDTGRLFLDFYGDSGIELGLERYGIFEALHRRGWRDFKLDTHAHDDRHTLLLDGVGTDGSTERLFELVVRRDQVRIEGVERSWESLTIDWLGLRNPQGAFTEERLRLPGQDAPGLGMAERVLELLYRVVARLQLDGLLTVAEHFHLAVLYAREFTFVDPYFAGQLGALMELLLGREALSFPQAAWAVHWGCVRTAEGVPFSWRGEAMVNARDTELAAWLGTAAHLERAGEIAGSLRFSLERAAFEERWAAESGDLLKALPTEEVRR